MSVRERVSVYRARTRAQGLGPVQIWVPDVRSSHFATEVHRQSALVAAADSESDDMDFVEAVFTTGTNEARRHRHIAGGVYASKPRPALIVEDDRFDASNAHAVIGRVEPTTLVEFERRLLVSSVSAPDVVRFEV